MTLSRSIETVVPCRLLCPQALVCGHHFHLFGHDFVMVPIPSSPVWWWPVHVVHGKTLWQQQRTAEGALAFAPICEAPDSEANAILEMAQTGTLQVVQEAGSTPKAVIPAHYLPQAGQPQVLQPGATQATVAQTPVAPTRGAQTRGTDPWHSPQWHSHRLHGSLPRPLWPHRQQCQGQCMSPRCHWRQVARTLSCHQCHSWAMACHCHPMRPAVLAVSMSTSHCQ